MKTAIVSVFKNRVTLLVIWALLLPIVPVVTILFSRSIESLKVDNMRLVTNVAEHISENMDNIMYQFMMLSDIFAGDPLLVEYCRKYYAQYPEVRMAEYREEYPEKLEALGLGPPEENGAITWHTLENSVFFLNGKQTPDWQKIILACRRTTNRETGRTAAHYLVLPEAEIYAKYFSYVYRKGPAILILDGERRVLSSSDPALLRRFGLPFDRETDTKTTMVSTVRSKYTDWQTIIMMPSQIVAAPMIALYRNLIIAIALIVLTVVTVSFVINYHLEKKEKHNRALEIKVLMGQINPHVVYNLLETIVWKANQARLPDIALIAAKLGTLLRLSISSSDTMKTLEQVIHHLLLYIDIEKIRYKERLEFEMAPFPDEFLEYKVPPLLLQPCVENAVMHGMKPGAQTLRIKLAIDKKGKDLYFHIMDNGTGIKSDKLEKIRKGQHFETRGSRIGIKNIQERLKIFFGKEYGLTIVSRENEGTCVTIKVPVLT
jgi:hypothetical protein